MQKLYRGNQHICTATYSQKWSSTSFTFCPRIRNRQEATADKIM